MKIQTILLLLVLGTLGSVGVCAAPVDFSFQGTFSADDDVQLFNFTVDGTSTVTVLTYSYAGGVQADGNVVSAGGFDPYLALFDSSGALIDQNDDGASVPIDPNTFEAFDAELSVLLAAGDYTVAVTLFDNVAHGLSLSDGFVHEGHPFFSGLFGCSNGRFCDASIFPPFDNRTNEWALDIVNVEAASAVPVPAAVWLFGSALVGLFGIASKRAV